MTQADTQPDDMVILGHIAGVFGVKGWVKVFSHTKPTDNILSYKQWYLQQQGHWNAIDLVKGQLHGKGIIAQLNGIDDRDVAAKLVKTQIAVPRNLLPEPADGDFYWRDLHGLEVIDQNDNSLGKVTSLFETGANDVMVVKQGKQEYLIPYIWQQVIRQVDLGKGIIKVDWDTDWQFENEPDDNQDD